MHKQPKSLTTALIFLLLNAAFWFAYAIITILTNKDAATVSHVARWIFAFLALGTSALLVVLYFLLRKRIRFAYSLILVVLALLAVLSLTDQVGLLDILSLLLSVIPLVLLVINHLYLNRIQ